MLNYHEDHAEANWESEGGPVYDPPEVSKRKIVLTEAAVKKIKEVMAAQEIVPAAVRLSVIGGGCAGFQYNMKFEDKPGMLDKTYDYDGLKVYVDQASLLYLEGVILDFVDSIEGIGFKFDNPNVKRSCGCGSSFEA